MKTFKYFVIKLGNDKKDEMVLSDVDNYFQNKYIIAPDKFREFWKGFSEAQRTKIKSNILDILDGNVSQNSKDMAGEAYNCDGWDNLIESVVLFRKKMKQEDSLEDSRIYLNMVGLSKWYEVELYLDNISKKVELAMSLLEV